ncbi:unnamed protein product [Ceratitis capitata]|uniref:(Mediterranean fruit fly) hypothetical protein n=1 Tax=Ceratitis capitata TaxID=7213 RepID=A0A811VG26_CERCA|nr:unnamed protein product [Ceratitis capitata]
MSKMLADDIEDNDEETTVVEEKFIKTKGKCKIHLRPNDIYLELKSKNRVGKCRGAGYLDIWDVSITMGRNNGNSIDEYNTIPNEIWYHVADHIPPEYVQTFALICRQTADLVNTRKFWNQLYKNYCLKPNGDFNWITALPEHLQMHSLRSCDKVTLRARVVESLFLTYLPLSERTAQTYSLDKLLGYSYVASWHEQENCAWIMCYKFRQKHMQVSKQGVDLTDLFPYENELDDWETLAENKSWFKTHYTGPRNDLNEGVSLLIIRCERYIPFPSQLLYESGESRALLLGIRQMLAKDMRGTNLELDFGETPKNVITTVKYPKVMSVKAYPWWYPEFRKYIK